jgi:hypothetical protein
MAQIFKNSVQQIQKLLSLHQKVKHQKVLNND